MKKLTLLLLTLTLSFMSCSKDATDVEFTTNLSTTSGEITVNDNTLRTPANDGTFETEFIIDLENEDTREYLDRLKDLELEDVKLTFQGLSGLAGNMTPTHLKISINNQVEINLNDFVYDRVAGGQEFAVNQSQLINEMAEILLNNKKVSVKIEGQIPDTATYHFYITIMAKARITAQAL